MNVQDTLGTPQRGKSQALAYTGTSAQSAVLTGADTICIQATTDCFIEVGLNPTATVNTSHFLGAYQPTYISINQVEPGFKIAAVMLSTGGTLYISLF